MVHNQYYNIKILQYYQYYNIAILQYYNITIGKYKKTKHIFVTNISRTFHLNRFKAGNRSSLPFLASIYLAILLPSITAY